MAKPRVTRVNKQAVVQKAKDIAKTTKQRTNAKADTSREAIKKAAQDKLEKARKEKMASEAKGVATRGPTRVDANQSRTQKQTKKPQKNNPDVVVNTEPPLIERAENFGIGPAGPAVIPPDKPILIAGFGPEKQGPVPPMQKQGPAFPMQQQAPAFPMQMMQGMGQGRPSVAQPGPAQMANAQQLQARALQLQARLNAARGQGGQTRFR
jgi:hypothetical protein